MKSVEFNNVFSRLCKYYGKENFIDDMGLRDIYFQEMQYITPDKWQLIEPMIFRKYKFMPKIAEICEIKKEVKDETQKKEKIFCKICNSSGYILVKKIIDDYPYEFGYACICGNGYKYDGRTIKDTKHRTDFCIRGIEELPEYQEIINGGVQ